MSLLLLFSGAQGASVGQLDTFAYPLTTLAASHQPVTALTARAIHRPVTNVETEN